MKMKAITLWQPWASLVAIGAKKIETRSWPTKYRGPLAIHAAKDRRYWKIAHDEPFRSVFMEARLYRQDDLPYGCIIATAEIVDCLMIQRQTFIGYPILKNGQEIKGNELAFGDYTPRRYAWILEDVKQLPEPIPAKGRQGLWNWEVPDGVVLS